MPEELQKLVTRIDDLTLRERAIILAGLLILLFLGWYAYLMEPLAGTEKNLLAALDQEHRELQTLNEQVEMMTREHTQDPDAANRKKLAQLRAEDAKVTKEVQKTASTLVTPAAMPDLLRRVLEQSNGLNLLGLKGLGSSPLIKVVVARPGSPKKSGKEPAHPEPAAAGARIGNAYKHGLEIRFSGDYFSTLEYMRKLEKLPWGFFWDRVEFKVGHYPQATASIRLFTLSLDSGWIGT